METILYTTRGGRVFLSSYQLGGSDTLQGSGVTSPGPGELRMAGMSSAFNKSHNGSAHTHAPVLINSACTQHRRGISGMGPSVVGRYPGMCQWPWEVMSSLTSSQQPGWAFPCGGFAVSWHRGSLGVPGEQHRAMPGAVVGTMGLLPLLNESRDCFTSRPGAGGV